MSSLRRRDPGADIPPVPLGSQQRVPIAAGPCRTSTGADFFSFSISPYENTETRARAADPCAGRRAGPAVPRSRRGRRCRCAGPARHPLVGPFMAVGWH